MKRYVNKLIRDAIPEESRSKREIPVIRELDKEEFILEAKRKLVEESQEVLTTKNHEELLEELADVAEIFEALAQAADITQSEIKQIREKKNSKKGAFKKKIYLHSVTSER